MNKLSKSTLSTENITDEDEPKSGSDLFHQYREMNENKKDIKVPLIHPIKSMNSKNQIKSNAKKPVNFIQKNKHAFKPLNSFQNKEKRNQQPKLIKNEEDVEESNEEKRHPTTFISISHFIKQKYRHKNNLPSRNLQRPKDSFYKPLINEVLNKPKNEKILSSKNSFDNDLEEEAHVGDLPIMNSNLNTKTGNNDNRVIH